ncbi:MAG TPA: MerR family transcriptional regulator [Caulobacteraceae bacterium]|jgi:DNA-binding transcriptional MerR regulator
MGERHYSPAEVSRLLGVSPKALRLYETRGLIKAVRTSNGWRCFGRAEIARLTQVLALKALRLPLARIAELLKSGAVSLDQVLAAHEAALAAEADKAARALGLVRAARVKLAAGETLSIDDLATLAKETTMTLKSGQKELGQLLEPHVRAHFSPDEIDETAHRPFDQDKIGADWDALIAEAKTLMAKGDPTSPAALNLARRWKAQVEQFTQGDPEMWKRVQGVWTDAMADPAAAPQLPLDPEIFAFVGKAMAGLS